MEFFKLLRSTEGSENSLVSQLHRPFSEGKKGKSIVLLRYVCSRSSPEGVNAGESRKNTMHENAGGEN